MAYLIGNDLKSGIVRPTLPRKASLPGKPVGLPGRATLEDVDPVALQQAINDANALRHATAENPSGAGYRDYGQKPSGQGATPTATAAPANTFGRQAIQAPANAAQWLDSPITFQQARDAAKALFPTPAENPARANDQDEGQIPTDAWDAPEQEAVQPSPPAQATVSEPFDWMGLANNPYKELAKLLPQGPLRTVVNGVGTGFQYLPSTLVRDYVMPVPGMLVKNAVKAVDDAAEGKPLSFDPEVSAYELFGRSAQAARRTGQTEIADGLEFLLNDPVGKVILSAFGEMALDPLTYLSGAGLAKGSKALQALKAGKAAKAADITADIQRAEKAARAMDTPPLRSAAVYEKPPLAKALEDEIQKTQNMGDANPPAVADEVPKGYTGSAGVEMPEPPQPASLSDAETRRWYLDAEAKLPNLIDGTTPLEQQARQAFELRNQFRTQARSAMSDRIGAQRLEATDPNLTWEEIVQKYTAKGFTDDALYAEIIKAATRSRTSINDSLGIHPR